MIWKYKILNPREVHLLSPLRDLKSLWLGLDHDGNQLWIRYSDNSPSTELRLKPIPFISAWKETIHSQLTPQNGCVPTQNVPDLNWVRISDYFHLKPIPVRSAKFIPSQTQIRLRRSSQYQKPSALLCDLEDLRQWLDQALELEFQHLKYALASNGAALTLGPRIPPVRGQSYWKNGSLLIPSGFEFELRLTSRILPETLRLKSGDIAIFDSSGNVEIIASGLFCPLTRQSIRHGELQWGLAGGTQS